MSKNFEEEYRQMIDSELPDLWARIEAQLPKAEAGTLMKEAQADGQTASAPGAAIQRDNVTAGRKKRFRGRRMPMAIGAAAVLCLIAALPVILLPRGNEENTDAAGGSAEEKNTCEGAVIETADAALNYDNGGGDDCADGAYAGDSPSDSEPSAADDLSALFPDFSMQEEEVQNDAEAVLGDNAAQSAGQESAVEEAADLYRMEVQILDSIWEEDGEIFYEAAVLQNEGNVAGKGERIFFRCVDTVFLPGEQYSLVLYSSGEPLENYGIADLENERYGKELYIVYEFDAN